MTSLLAVADEGTQYTGPIGLLIVVLIGVVTVLLIMNMNKRIKRLPPSFPEEQGPDDEPPPQQREV